jgi:hypothetical protein
MDSCLTCFDNYISNDTIKLYYSNPDGFIVYHLLKNGTYSLRVSYVTDLMNTYPED